MISRRSSPSSARLRRAREHARPRLAIRTSPFRLRYLRSSVCERLRLLRPLRRPHISHARYQRAREISVRRVRRSGRVEPCQAAARVSVLRDLDAVQGRRGDRQHRRDRSREDAARVAGRAARMDDGQADGPVSKLQGRHGLRSGSSGPELRVLRIARARRLHGNQGSHPPAEPAPVQGESVTDPRADARVVREQMARAECLQDQGAGRSRPWPLHSVLDVRRPGRLPLGCGGGALLLHDRDRSAERTHGDASGPARQMGACVR